MSVCGCSINLVYEQRTLEVEGEFYKVAYFENEKDFNKYLGVWNTAVNDKGEIEKKSVLSLAVLADMPKWAKYYALRHI